MRCCLASGVSVGMMDPRIGGVIAWCRDAVENWFSQSPTFDAAFRTVFAPPVQDCHGGRPCGLAGHPRSRSGPVDPARSLSPQYVGRCITQTRTPCRRHRMPANKALSTECRQNYAFFVFLHFARSEALEDQDQSVALHHRFLPSELWRARRCRDIITHFGRFPNRQRIFNRTLPPEESRYLNAGGFQG